MNDHIWPQYIIFEMSTLKDILSSEIQNRHDCSLPHMGAFGGWARRGHCVASLYNKMGNLEGEGN